MIAAWTPRLFLLLGVPLGLFYALAMPPLQVPDEAAHFVRAFGISQGRCIASRETPVPEGVVNLLGRYKPGLEQREKFSADEWRQAIGGTMPDVPSASAGAVSANLYSCVLYLPAAAAIRVERVFEASAGLAMYLGRLGSLAAFLALTFLALRLIPDFHALLLALALMPMTLHQAASLSADSMTMAFAFLFSAYALRLRSSPGTIGRAEWLKLAALVSLIGMGKLNVWLVLLVALIPAEKFGSRRRWWMAVGGYFALVCAVTLLWQWANSGATQAYQESVARMGTGTDLAANRSLLLGRPLETLRSLAVSFVRWPWVFGPSFVGTFGYLSVLMPKWATAFYLALLLGIAATQAQRTRFSARDRMLLAGIAAVSTATVLLVLSIIWTNTEALRAILANGERFDGSQGRYYIPFAISGLLALSNAKPRLNGRVSLWIAAACCTAANGIGAQTILAAFYR